MAGVRGASLDCIHLAKLGLHVPEFHVLHGSRIAWAVGGIWHDIRQAKESNSHILFASDGQRRA